MTTPPEDGTVTTIGPDHLDAKARVFASEIEYARKAEAHLWTVMQLHVVSGDSLTQLAEDGGAPLLDGETFRAVEVGCYVCEQPFSPRLVQRKCQAARR